MPDPSRVLVIGCGALARELVAVMDQAGLSNVDLTCLPATLHNRPVGIPAAVRAKIRAARPRYERIFIAYADCGTGGLLDAVLADEGVERLPGAHCYEFYAGSSAFAAMSAEDPGTFYLTDFLARNFDRLVIKGLGLDRHPELLPAYFGNYRRLVYLAQTDDPGLVRAARRAARRLGLAFELRRTGYGDLATSVVGAAGVTSGAGEASGAAAAASGAAGAASGAAGAASGAGLGSPAAARFSSPLASDASNVARPPKGGTESVDSLRAMQETSPRPNRRDQDLRVTQEIGRRTSRGRRWLRPVQGPAGILREAQETAAPAGTASSATKATTRSSATTATTPKTATSPRAT